MRPTSTSHDRGHRRPAPPFLRWSLLIAVGTIAAVRPVSAQSSIIKTRKSASSTWSPILPLTVGAGVEFENSSEQTEYDFPFFADYNFTETFRVHVEPTYVYIHGKSEDVSTVHGLGDLETSAEYEFLRERRYTPGLTVESLIRWPTATDPDIGNAGTDYSLGLNASKDCVFFELNTNLRYTFSGDSGLQDTLEASLAVEYPLSHFFALEAEIVRTEDSGHAGPDGSSNITEGTLGCAWHVTPFTTLEQGVIIRSDGSWQALLGWQYSFGGD